MLERIADEFVGDKSEGHHRIYIKVDFCNVLVKGDPVSRNIVGVKKPLNEAIKIFFHVDTGKIVFFVKILM